MRSLLFYFLLAFPLFSLAQSSAFSLIYELSNEAYEEKVRAKRFELTPEDCQVLVGATDTLNWERVPAGYYIEAKVSGEKLRLSVLDRTGIHAILLNNERDFAVQVIDTLGNLAASTTTQVWLNDKPVKYDIETQSYRLDKHKKDGLLKVSTRQQVLLYDIDLSNPKLKNNRKKFRETYFGYIVNTPIRTVKNGARFFKRGFKHKTWRVYRWGKIIPFWKKFHRGKELKGYLVTNSPIYRHGDTLKLKAYVAKNNGKPWKKDVELIISGYRFEKSTTLIPDETGNVLFAMRLGDSLRLDQNYKIILSAFYGHNRHYHNSLESKFKLEDYQLDEVNYNFSSTQKEYLKGEKIVLLAEGKDENGFNVTDGKVNITARRGSVRGITDSMIYIPDTLWTLDTVLNTRGLTQLIFPDSLLPQARLEIKLYARFTNQNGELHNKYLSIQYGRQKKYDLKLENGFLLAESNSGQQNDSISIIRYIDKYNNYKQIEEIILPYKEPINPYVKDYALILKKDSTTRYVAQLRAHDPKISVTGNYKQDTVKIKLNNLHRIPINYWISRGEKIISYGQTNETEFDWSRKDKSHKPYHIRYQYIWRGTSQYKIASIQHFKNKLYIDVEEPKAVTPGGQAQVKVKVRDAENREIKNVNLTAGAINAQLNSNGNITDMNIEYKTAKALKKRGIFSSKSSKKRYSQSYHLSDEWSERFKLDSLLFYRLRLPEQAIRKEYISFEQDSFYREIAQFAPYLIEKGWSRPIFMIYCNRNLVYYHETDNNTPYSFIGREGYNNEMC